jgi:hypothetical protein
MWKFLLQTFPIFANLNFHNPLATCILETNGEKRASFIKWKAWMNAYGCKQDILYILVIFFSTWKHKKIVFQTSNLPFTFQNKWNFFFHGPPSSFQKQFVLYHFGLKNTPKKPHLRVVMILVMKTNSINQKYYIRMFITPKPNTCKNISSIFKYLNYIFQICLKF